MNIQMEIAEIRQSIKELHKAIQDVRILVVQLNYENSIKNVNQRQ